MAPRSAPPLFLLPRRAYSAPTMKTRLPRRFRSSPSPSHSATYHSRNAADLVAEIGWDGIECPVRARSTHIAPERVEEDLPRFVEALKRCGKRIEIVTTDVRNLDDPLSERVLRTASQLGIRRYRLGSWRYHPDQPLDQQWADIRSGLADLVALNKELGLKAGFQNHSGANRVGAPIWDIDRLIDGFDRDAIGLCFDIGHATVEGGYAWPIHAPTRARPADGGFRQGLRLGKTRQPMASFLAPTRRGNGREDVLRLVGKRRVTAVPSASITSMNWAT